MFPKRFVCSLLWVALVWSASPVSASAPEAQSPESDSAMPLFAVQIKTGPAWDKAKPPHEQSEFAAHSAHLKALRDAGHIVVGARYSDIGLIFVKAQSADAARSLMANDPSMMAGTFVFEVFPLLVFYGGDVPMTPRPKPPVTAK